MMTRSKELLLSTLQIGLLMAPVAALVACGGSGSSGTPNITVDAGMIDDGSVTDSSVDAGDAAVVAVTCTPDCTRGKSCLNDGNNVGVCMCDKTDPSGGNWNTPVELGDVTAPASGAAMVSQSTRFEHDDKFAWAIDLPNLGATGSSVRFDWDYTWTYGTAIVEVFCGDGAPKTLASTCTGSNSRSSNPPMLQELSTKHLCANWDFNDSGHIILDFECNNQALGARVVVKTQINLPHGTFSIASDPSHPLTGENTRTPDSLCIEGSWTASISK